MYLLNLILQHCNYLVLGFLYHLNYLYVFLDKEKYLLSNFLLCLENLKEKYISKQVQFLGSIIENKYNDSDTLNGYYELSFDVLKNEFLEIELDLYVHSSSAYEKIFISFYNYDIPDYGLNSFNSLIMTNCSFRETSSIQSIRGKSNNNRITLYLSYPTSYYNLGIAHLKTFGTVYKDSNFLEERNAKFDYIIGNAPTDNALCNIKKI